MLISCCHAAASTRLLAVLIQLLLCDAAAGMKCGGCVGHVKKILESQPGVIQARHTPGSLLVSPSLSWRRSLAHYMCSCLTECVHKPVTVILTSPNCTCPVRCDPQATVNLATETALVHVLVPKGSKGQHGAPSPQALAAGDRLTQVCVGEWVLGKVSNGWEGTLGVQCVLLFLLSAHQARALRLRYRGTLLHDKLER